MEPPVNDIWSVSGEEHLLSVWQEEDRATAKRLDPMSYYHKLQIEDFLDAVIEDREPLVTGEEGRKVVEMFSAIYRSQRDDAREVPAGGGDGTRRLRRPAELYALEPANVASASDIRVNRRPRTGNLFVERHSLGGDARHGVALQPQARPAWARRTRSAGSSCSRWRCARARIAFREDQAGLADPQDFAGVAADHGHGAGHRLDQLRGELFFPCGRGAAGHG